MDSQSRLGRGASRSAPLVALLALAAACDDAPPCGPGSRCHDGQNDDDAVVSVGVGGSDPDPGSGFGGADGGAGGQGGEGGRGPTQVTVSVIDNSDEPGIALDVIANGPDGELVDQGVTGVDGTVEMMVPDGGSVSLLYSDDYADSQGTHLYRRIETAGFEGKPHQTVRFNAFYYADAEPGGSTMSVTVNYPMKTGVSQYAVLTTCNNGGSSSALTRTMTGIRDCTGNGLYDVVVAALGAEGAIVDYAMLEGQPFAPGAGATHNLQWTVKPVGQLVAVVSNIPTIAEGLGASSSRLKHQGAGFVELEHRRYAEDLGTEQTMFFSVPVDFGSDHCVTMSVEMPQAKAHSLKNRCTPGPSLTPFAWDVSRLSRFEITGGTVQPPSVQWDEGWSGQAGDLLSISAGWEYEGVGLFWSIHLQPGAGSVSLPELPDDLVAYALVSEQLGLMTSVWHVDRDELDGFEDALGKGVPPRGWRNQESNLHGLALP